MANEVIMVQSDPQQSVLPVTQVDVEAMKRQRELLKQFVTSQLVEADFSEAAKTRGTYGEGDYGVIPGTRKRCLFKQGAEKFQKLFTLGVSFEQVDKEIDRNSNFAMVTYKAKVYSLRNPGVIIAECIGSVNSQETKYKQRTSWKTVRRGNKEVRENVTEETPIFDILNTLQKMAQKRAMIGATILATGASEYFTQDVLEPEELASAGQQQQQPAAEAPAKAPAQASGSAEEPPEHCGKPMMISRYEDRERGGFPWFCLACKAKIPRGAA